MEILSLIGLAAAFYFFYRFSREDPGSRRSCGQKPPEGGYRFERGARRRL